MIKKPYDFDVLIVGAGPSGLSAAINFKKLCKQNDKDFSVCVVEKGSEVGAHILSGAILEPRALDELIEDHKEQSNLRKIESLEQKLINNLDENSYSELIKLKSQLNRE